MALWLFRRVAIVLASVCVIVIAARFWYGPIGHATGPVVITGTAAVGGPFQLTDHTGRAISDRDFHGKSLVIYFGWRLDPDLTPAALQVLSASLDTLGRKSEHITPLFISVDPGRDTPQELHDFVKKFDNRLVGLSGTPGAIAALAAAYKLYFKQHPAAALPGGYSIDHASLYYVMGPQGEFLGVVPHTTNVVALSQELHRLLK